MFWIQLRFQPAPLKKMLVMPAFLAAMTSVVLSPTYQTSGPFVAFMSSRAW